MTYFNEPYREQPSVYALRKEAEAKSYLGAWPTYAQMGCFGYLVANRDLVSQVVAIDSTWMLFVFIFMLFITAALGMGISGWLCYHYTGIVYAEDRKAFALVGGFDVGRVPMIVTQVAFFGLYWWTAQMTPDPIAYLRGPWMFLLWSTIVGLILTAIVGCIVFKYHQEGEIGG